MRDKKAGFIMNASLFLTVLLTAVAAAYLFAHRLTVHYIVFPIALVGMLLAYKKSLKFAGIVAGALIAVLTVLTLIFWPDQIMHLVYAVIWTFLQVLCVAKLRQGVNGLVSERDYYRAQSERISMIDPITQMRNYHAFLNDAPIYIKIARRYKLDMVVMVLRMKNAAEIRDALDEMARREMLEALSQVIHRSIRLEDLAYLTDNEACVWCLNMFTRVDMIDVVIDRLQKGVQNLGIKRDDGTPCVPDFTFAYSVVSADDERTPATLYQQALEKASAK